MGLWVSVSFLQQLDLKNKIEIKLRYNYTYLIGTNGLSSEKKDPMCTQLQYSIGSRKSFDGVRPKRTLGKSSYCRAGNLRFFWWKMTLRKKEGNHRSKKSASAQLCLTTCCLPEYVSKSRFCCLIDRSKGRLKAKDSLAQNFRLKHPCKATWWANSNVKSSKKISRHKIGKILLWRDGSAFFLRISNQVCSNCSLREKLGSLLGWSIRVHFQYLESFRPHL